MSVNHFSHRSSQLSSITSPLTPSPLPKETPSKIIQLSRLFRKTHSLSAARTLSTLLHDSYPTLPIYSEILRPLETAAKSGHAKAACILPREDKKENHPCHCTLLSRASIHLNANRYTSALDLLRRAADAGVAEAHAELAETFLKGLGGVEKDLEYGIICYRRGAEAGDVVAQTSLARLLLLDTDTNQETEEEAEKMAFEAANSGHAPGAVILGLFFVLGSVNIERNRNLAQELYTLARREGDRGAVLAEYFLTYDHEGCHPDMEYCVKAVHEASKREGAGWLLLCGVRKWYGTRDIKADLTEAAELFRQAAEMGDTWAMCNLGFMKERGVGTPQSYEDALALYGAAEDRGLKRAICRRADMYRCGRGVTRNLQIAIDVLGKAMELDSIMGMWMMGIVLLEGGSDKDVKKVFEFFSECVKYGFEVGYVLLADMYGNGICVQPDSEKAAELLEKAGKSSYPHGKFMYGVWLRHQGRLEDASKFLRDAAEKKSSGAMVTLGNMYESGEHFAVDHARARSLYMKSVSLGDPGGMLALADLLVRWDDGDGAEIDMGNARLLYEAAAELGNNCMRCQALHGLGEMSACGLGVERDIVGAMKLYETSASYGARFTGARMAMTRLGLHFERGCGVKADAERAAKWYGEAVHGGSAYAAFRLGFLLENGDGVEQDVEKAFQYYRFALERGCFEAAVPAGMLLERQQSDGTNIRKEIRNLFEVAAFHGIVLGEFHYGRFLTADGNWKTGMSWIQIAAQHGSLGAKEMLDGIGSASTVS